MYIAAPLQNLLDLIGGNRIHSTTEGVELDHLQIGFVAHSGGGLVEPRVIGPLIAHAQRALQPPIADRILGEYAHTQPVDHLGNAVVDLGI